MIKKYYQITIRDYNQIEQSGKIGHLVRWWFVPVFLVSRLIYKEIEKANKLLNAEENDTYKLRWKVESLAKINAIQANVMGLFNLCFNPCFSGSGVLRCFIVRLCNR